jgi:hypothetical protein
MRFASAIIAILTLFVCLIEPSLSGSGSTGASFQGLELNPPGGSFELERATAFNVVLNKTQITAYPYFESICSAFVVGYHNVGTQIYPTRGNFSGNCQNNPTPILFSVTHENDKNNHNGSANYDTNIVAYMGDLNFAADFGRWLNSAFHPLPDGTALLMSLDTVNYQQINVTGWPLQFGHLFFGANDLSVNTTLDQSIFVDFDIRVPQDVIRSELYTKGYSGHRVMVGARATWDETAPRINKSHFLEIDLIQTGGYSASYREPIRPLCKDVQYDRCFYSENGKYAEGREISYRILLQNSIPTNTSQWVHVNIPLSEIFKKLRWVSPAESWASAKLNGLYIGIESEGATQTSIEIRNYQVYREN